jgi:hypothetical protein
MSTWPGPPAAGDGETFQGRYQAPPGLGQERVQLPPGAEQAWGSALPNSAAWAPPPPGWVQAAGRPASNGLATASLVLGITSIVFCWWGLLTLAQVVLAIVFGCIGIGRANRGASGRGLAVAGLCCGCVGAAAYFIFGIATLGIGFLI